MTRRSRGPPRTVDEHGEGAGAPLGARREITTPQAHLAIAACGLVCETPDHVSSYLLGRHPILHLYRRVHRVPRAGARLPAGGGAPADGVRGRRGWSWGVSGARWSCCSRHGTPGLHSIGLASYRHRRLVGLSFRCPHPAGVRGLRKVSPACHSTTSALWWRHRSRCCCCPCLDDAHGFVVGMLNVVVCMEHPRLPVGGPHPTLLACSALAARWWRAASRYSRPAMAALEQRNSQDEVIFRPDAVPADHQPGGAMTPPIHRPGTIRLLRR
jgi:hypothetical protein